MVIDAAIVRTASEWEIVGVLRPDEGGQVDSAVMMC